MAIISAFTLIRAISLFHITAAYLFLTAPKVIADQNVVFILGESMRLVRQQYQACMCALHADFTHSLTPPLWTSRMMLPALSEFCWHFLALLI